MAEPEIHIRVFKTSIQTSEPPLPRDKNFFLMSRAFNSLYMTKNTYYTLFTQYNNLMKMIQLNSLPLSSSVPDLQMINKYYFQTNTETQNVMHVLKLWVKDMFCHVIHRDSHETPLSSGGVQMVTKKVEVSNLKMVPRSRGYSCICPIDYTHWSNGLRTSCWSYQPDSLYWNVTPCRSLFLVYFTWFSNI